jgi:chromosome segregation ATPase
MKVSATGDGVDDLEKELAEAKEENAKLRATVAKHEEDLRILREHLAVMECKASDASKVKDRVMLELAKLSEEFKGLQVKHFALQESHATLQAGYAELQEDHSILNEKLGQLEEKHMKTLEQLTKS